MKHGQTTQAAASARSSIHDGLITPTRDLLTIALERTASGIVPNRPRNRNRVRRATAIANTTQYVFMAGHLTTASRSTEAADEAHAMTPDASTR